MLSLSTNNGLSTTITQETHSMQRYAKIPESVIRSGDSSLIALWALLYLEEVARHPHSHKHNMKKYGMNRSRYYRIVRRVRAFIENDNTQRSRAATQVRLKRDSSKTQMRLKRDSSETQTPQTIPAISESIIPEWDSSDTKLTLERDSSDTEVRPEQDSPALQVRRAGLSIGPYKDKEKNQDHDIYYEEPRLKSDRELFEMNTVDRLRFIQLNEQRLKQAGRI